MEKYRLDELNIDSRLIKHLNNMGIEYIDEVAQFNKHELESFGIKEELVDYLLAEVKKFYIKNLKKQDCQKPANQIQEEVCKKDDLTDSEKLLMSTDLFKELPVELIKKLAKILKSRSYLPSERIIDEGGKGDSLFLINNGLVDVRKKDPQTGIEFSLTQLGPPACVGEMSLLTGHPRSASVVALEQTEVFYVTNVEFEKLIEFNHPQFALSLSRVLARRLEEANTQKGVSYVNLAKFNFDPRVFKLLPKAAILQHKMVPLALIGSSLTLAMVNPNDLMALDDIRRFIKGVLISPIMVTEKDFEKFIKNVYDKNVEKDPDSKKEGDDAVTVETRKETKVVETKEEEVFDEDALEELRGELEIEDGINDEEGSSIRELTSAAGDAPIIRLANTVLGLAIKNGVSDIHIEPQEKEVVIRNRRDGMLMIAQVLPKKVQLPLISRFKIISNMDIAEKRVPQDGRISVRQGSRNIDFRVNTIPCKFGEKIVMRLLDKSNTTMGLDKLISRQEQLDLVREMIKQPYGIIFVTGPTGSGKTTTLYSALAERNSTDVNICTAEDPIEYDLAGINQVQINHKIGLDFAKVLRAFLRQDPDIMLVGETRDKETAKVSVEAALTGHLVFTTLHTNDAPGAITRLGEMGVESFLIGSATIGIMAQRLARRICQACKKPYEPDEVTLKYLGIPAGSKPIFYKSEGCPVCKNGGYKGRVGIYEVMRLNDDLRRLIASEAEEAKIRDAARANGMKTLIEYGVELIKDGQTSVEELLRVVAT